MKTRCDLTESSKEGPWSKKGYFANDDDDDRWTQQYTRILKTAICWNVWKTFTDVSEEGTSYSLGLVFETEDRGTTFLRNVDENLSDYTM
jgi:hypothetical protein